eukprot:TRINITY_DN5295_c0_g1_i1.p1 TRINITY_DN5295_c0_g1~~TRINITY_DN5295_c0_g1_i1.p1  ORF type:complete len:457 (-),score=21.27 TRINITY_DN5295_c0_g1_i1:1765-3135(-)
MSISMQLPPLPPVSAESNPLSQEDSDCEKECTYFSRTGCCSFGNDCKFKHDPSKLLPLAGYTESGYPIRPGCEACTFYVATGWCNHWFSCSKDHDGTRLSGDCNESLPPPTIMEQFHRFKYHSFTKEYKPLSTNHLPPAIRDKRWIVGNEYGQSAIPRSAQNRILQSFKNGIPEDVKDRLYRFLPQDTKNMQLIRNSTGGYLSAVHSGALSRALSAPHQHYVPHPGMGFQSAVISNKIMTPHPTSPTTTVHQQAHGQPQQAQYATAAAAAAGYQINRLSSYHLDLSKSQYPGQRYYDVIPSTGQNLPSYNSIYPTAYSVDTGVASSRLDSPDQPSPNTSQQQVGYYYAAPAAVRHPQQASQYLSASSQHPALYGQYTYMYSPSEQQYAVPAHIAYPQHGWSYANIESSGDSSAQTGQLTEDQDGIESAFKGCKATDEHGSVLEEDADAGLFYEHSH